MECVKCGSNDTKIVDIWEPDERGLVFYIECNDCNHIERPADQDGGVVCARRGLNVYAY